MPENTPVMISIKRMKSDKEPTMTPLLYREEKTIEKKDI